jgi:hypothetical protein
MVVSVRHQPKIDRIESYLRSKLHCKTDRRPGSGPGYVNLDLGPIKFIPLGNEMRLQFRTEFFNLTSTPHFANPVVRMSDPAFGRITHTRNPINFGSAATSYASRMIQFAVKLEF